MIKLNIKKAFSAATAKASKSAIPFEGVNAPGESRHVSSHITSARRDQTSVQLVPHSQSSTFVVGACAPCLGSAFGARRRTVVWIHLQNGSASQAQGRA